MAPVTSEMEEETNREDKEEKQMPCIVDFSMHNNDGRDAASMAAEHNRTGIITRMSDVIERLLDASMHGAGGRIKRSPPSCPWLSSLPSGVASEPKTFVDHDAYSQPQADPEPPPTHAATLLPPSQTLMGWSRHRTQSKPHLPSPD